MAQFSRTRTSRTIVSVTVIAVAIGAAYQFHRLRKTDAVSTPPPLQMSMTPRGSNLVIPAPQPAVTPQVTAATPPQVNPLVTQTPDLTKRVSTNDSHLLPLHDPRQAPPANLLSNNNQAGTPPAGSTLAAPAGNTQVTNTPAGNAPAGNTLAVNTPVPPVAAPQQNANPAAASSDAAAKVTAGDLLGARTILNSALVSGKLSSADSDTVKKQLADLNQTIVFSPRQFPKDPLGGIYVVKASEHLSSIATAHQVPFELLLSINGMKDARKLRFNQSLKIINGPFYAVVTKSRFTLDIYLGSPGGADSTYITTFAVGLGTDNSTPTGTWKIKDKVTHPAYFPPEGHPGPTLLPDDPKNPLGPYWLGLEGTDGQAVGQHSYGIHGTIDPASIGKQSSMGCIRLKNEDVEMVYKLLAQGKSTVVVKD